MAINVLFFTKLCYSKGLTPKVFVRDEKKIPEHLRDKVEAVVGDVTNAEEVSNAISNTSGVVVVLGTRNDLSECFNCHLKKLFVGIDEWIYFNVINIILYVYI